jgi:hypothetical protein
MTVHDDYPDERYSVLVDGWEMNTLLLTHDEAQEKANIHRLHTDDVRIVDNPTTDDLRRLSVHLMELASWADTDDERDWLLRCWWWFHKQNHRYMNIIPGMEIRNDG